MDYTFLERLKTKVIAGAQTSAARIEDAARTGKLHLDLMAARRKLQRAHVELGKEACRALSAGLEAELARHPGVPELRSEIEAHKKEIVALEARLAEGKDGRGRPA